MNIPPTPELEWQKTTRSGITNCVEVAPLPGGGVAMRDSKDPSGPFLRYTAMEWALFAEGMQAGEFDNLLVVDQ